MGQQTRFIAFDLTTGAGADLIFFLAARRHLIRQRRRSTTRLKLTIRNFHYMKYTSFSQRSGILIILQGGLHELQNEPHGVKEKLANEVILFIESHLSQDTTQGTTSEGRSKM